MKKVLTCFLSLIPLLSYVGIFILMIPFCFLVEYIDPNMDYVISYIFLAVLAIYLLLMIASVYAVMIRDIILICRNKEVKTETKIIWCIAFYFFNMFSFPVFWFMIERKK